MSDPTTLSSRQSSPEKSPAKPSARQRLLEKVNASAGPFGRIEYQETIPFGPSLRVARFRMQNGLGILHLFDPSAPVISYHTWFRVGSVHEQPGKTGLAHLFEHLMFNEIEGLKAGEFDRKMEAAGADSNASTWLDFTQYQEAFPKDQLRLIVDLESRRMNRLVLAEPQVVSEKDVVMNERRYRVDDDVEGSVEEELFKLAFQKHPYHAPTIGFMADIASFETTDCEAFYRTYYAPNNACLVVVGDVNESTLLPLLSAAYGSIGPSELPLLDISPEPHQTGERRLELKKPTSTEKLALGFKGPALGDQDHLAVSILLEILLGGRSSRLQKRLIRDLSLASDARGSVGPHRFPSLIEMFASARGKVTAEALLAIFDEECQRIRQEPVPQAELERALSRSELGTLSGLETADGKASTLGFYETILGRPALALERLEAMRRLTPSDILYVARRYLDPQQRSIVFVRPQDGELPSEAEEAPQ